MFDKLSVTVCDKCHTNKLNLPLQGSQRHRHCIHSSWESNHLCGSTGAGQAVARKDGTPQLDQDVETTQNEEPNSRDRQQKDSYLFDKEDLNLKNSNQNVCDSILVYLLGPGGTFIKSLCVISHHTSKHYLVELKRQRPTTKQKMSQLKQCQQPSD